MGYYQNDWSSLPVASPIKMLSFVLSDYSHHQWPEIVFYKHFIYCNNTIHELKSLLFIYLALIVGQRLPHLFANNYKICLLLCGYLWEDFRDMNGLHWFIFLWFCNHMNSPVHTHGKSCSQSLLKMEMIILNLRVFFFYVEQLQ